MEDEELDPVQDRLEEGLRQLHAADAQKRHVDYVLQILAAARKIPFPLPSEYAGGYTLHPDQVIVALIHRLCDVEHELHEYKRLIQLSEEG